MRYSLWFRLPIIIILLSFILLGCNNNSEEADQSPSGSPNQQEENLISNDFFILESPTPDQLIGKSFTIKGKARGLFEADFFYEFEDGHSILSQGFVMTRVKDDPSEWGEFEHTITLESNPTNPSGTLILYEENAENGSRINTLIISFKFDPSIVKSLDD